MSKTPFIPSRHQAAVFDFVSTGTGSAIIEAVAGAGKTTTIVKALELIDPKARTMFLAFNKKIATELQAKVPAHVKAATFHSQGFNAWRKWMGNVATPNANKIRELIKRNFAPMEAEAFGATIARLVSVAKSAGVGALVSDTEETWQGLADHYDINLPDGDDMRKRTLEAASYLLSLSVDAAMASPSVIDFDDMLYMPLLKEVPFAKVDFLFVDESQDTNAVQLALLRRMLVPGGRLIAVGDPRQAIYGFRGADASAMKNLQEAFNCITLPLTISYRCAQAIVKQAQTIVSHIEASPTAIMGEVLSATVEKTEFRNTDAIICRNTAPVVELAYQLIGKGIGCKVLGREIGQALNTLIKQMGASDLDTMIAKLDEFRARETAKFMAKGQEQRAEAVNDKVDCIHAIVNNLTETARSLTGLYGAIDRMFSDDAGSERLTLCTAHKSKGLEWKRVFVYRPELMPSKYARQAWQQEQESNLQYVAWTRAMETLVFLSQGTPAAAPLKTASVAAPAVKLTYCQRQQAAIAAGTLAPSAFWLDMMEDVAS